MTARKAPGASRLVERPVSALAEIALQSCRTPRVRLPQPGHVPGQTLARLLTGLSFLPLLAAELERM